MQNPFKAYLYGDGNCRKYIFIKPIQGLYIWGTETIVNVYLLNPFKAYIYMGTETIVSIYLLNPFKAYRYGDKFCYSTHSRLSLRGRKLL